MSPTTPQISIPADLLPADGRFGSGPSKVRPEAVAALAEAGATLLGTSHRQAPVKSLVARLREGLHELFSLPDGWEVVLGNGGTTVFWDAATFGLIRSRSHHYVFGEFSSKFAAASATAPFLDDPVVSESATGTHPPLEADPSADLIALTHNETSTGVAMNLIRPAGAADDALVAVDATSGAGGLRWDPSQVDAYYFAPQKGFASDGGLWIACCSPAAVQRIGEVSGSGRWIPTSIDLTTALDNSRQDQTYNTPALATLFLAVHQLEWMNTNGGLEFSAGRCDTSASILYGWAESSEFVTPYVTESQLRSSVVATIDFDDAVDAKVVSSVLRANRIVDTESYRKLGRNQIRVAMFPAIDPADVEALTTCIDFVVGKL